MGVFLGIILCYLQHTAIKQVSSQLYLTLIANKQAFWHFMMSYGAVSLLYQEPSVPIHFLIYTGQVALSPVL